MAGVGEQRERAGPPAARCLDHGERKRQRYSAVQRGSWSRRVIVMLVTMFSHAR
jgi:hypothetical protein